METKICRHCSCQFDITDKDLEFYEKVSPIFPLSQPFPPREKGVKENIPLNGGETKGGVLSLGNGKIKYLIPPPTLCPDCRQQRRLSFRNERKLYKRKCDFSGKEIISIYSPDKNYKVYDHEIWWSDKWEVLDYGKDFDFNKSFFEQFQNLQRQIPRPGLHVVQNENSSFVNQCGYSKGSYMSFNTDFSENCYYCNNAFKCINCVDILNADSCENCYFSVDIKNCYNCFFSQECKDSSDIFYSYNLESCKNCFGCINLSNQQYHIFNQKFSREEYFENIKIYKNEKNKTIEIFNKLKLENPHLYANIKNYENAIGNNLVNIKNAHHCFDCFSDENIAYCSITSDAKNFYDFDVGGYYSELHYEVVSSGDKNLHCCFDTNIWGNSSDIYYSDIVIGCSHLFGCIGLRNKSYCILNKQYTKEEYEKLVPKIIENMMTPPQSPSIEGEARNEQGEKEWGEFFPSSFSPFGYNETVANEYFPLESSELSVISQETDTFKVCKLKTGNGKLKINWSDYEAPFPKVEKIIPASKLPSNITEIPDDILNWAIEDEERKTIGLNPLFRIIPQELEFYRKHNLPIPRKHPDQRHLDRMKLRNPRKLFTRNCDKCKKEIQTTYTPERPEIIYCQECYSEEVY